MQDNQRWIEQWIGRSLLPLLVRANPHRFSSGLPGIASRAICYYGGQEDTRVLDFHLDKRLPPDVSAFVTIGVMQDGTPRGTLGTLNPEHRSYTLNEITENGYRDDIIETPPYCAAVFDPTTELHAAPPLLDEEYRTLYTTTLTGDGISSMPLVNPFADVS